MTKTRSKSIGRLSNKPKSVLKSKVEPVTDDEKKYVIQLTEAYGYYTRNDNVVVTESQRNKMLKAGVIRL